MTSVVFLFIALFAQAAVPPKPARIGGFVTSTANGLAIASVQVTLKPENGASRTVRTDVDGKFVAQDLTSGLYQIDVQRNGYVALRGSGGSASVVVTAGQEILDVALRLTPAGVITGRVLDDNRQSVKGVLVQALQYQYRDEKKLLVPIASGASDDRGEYRIFGLQPGDYLIRAEASSTGRLETVFYPGVSNPNDAAMVRMSAGEERSAVDFSLRRVTLYAVRFRIVNPKADGKPLNPSFTSVPRGIGPVVLTLNTNFKKVGPEDYEGTMAPGSYEIIAATTRPLGHISVDVVDKDVDAGVLVLKPGVSISGRLVISNSLTAGIDPSRLSITSRSLDFAFNSNSVPAAPITADGSFATPLLSEEHYRFAVNGLPPDAYVGSIRFGSREVLHTGLTLGNEPPGPMEIFLDGPAAVVQGIVRNNKDEPVPNSLVLLVPERQYRVNPAAFKTGFTDQRGFFVIRGVPAGQYGALACGDLESGAYQDPEVLAALEPAASRLTVERGGHPTLELRRLPGCPSSQE